MPNNTPVEDNEKLNKRGLSTLWSLILAYFRPISAEEIDEITGVNVDVADDIPY